MDTCIYEKLERLIYSLEQIVHYNLKNYNFVTTYISISLEDKDISGDKGATVIFITYEWCSLKLVVHVDDE